MFFHSLFKNFFNSTLVEINSFDCFTFIKPQAFSIGLRSGEYPGQSSIIEIFFSIYFLFFMADYCKDFYYDK